MLTLHAGDSNGGDVTADGDDEDDNNGDGDGEEDEHLHADDDMRIPWIKGPVLGRGAFGTVCVALNTTTGTFFAAKQVDLMTCISSLLFSPLLFSSLLFFLLRIVISFFMVVLFAVCGVCRRRLFVHVGVS